MFVKIVFVLHYMIIFLNLLDIKCSLAENPDKTSKNQISSTGILNSSPENNITSNYNETSTLNFVMKSTTTKNSNISTDIFIPMSKSNITDIGNKNQIEKPSSRKVPMVNQYKRKTFTKRKQKKVASTTMEPDTQTSKKIVSTQGNEKTVTNITTMELDTSTVSELTSTIVQIKHFHSIHEVSPANDNYSARIMIVIFLGLCLTLGGYIGFQKRKKIIAFLVEGRRRIPRDRRTSGSKEIKVSYKPLESEDKEALMSNYKYVY